MLLILLLYLKNTQTFLKETPIKDALFQMLSTL